VGSLVADDPVGELLDDTGEYRGICEDLIAERRVGDRLDYPAVYQLDLDFGPLQSLSLVLSQLAEGLKWRQGNLLATRLCNRVGRRVLRPASICLLTSILLFADITL